MRHRCPAEQEMQSYLNSSNAIKTILVDLSCEWCHILLSRAYSTSFVAASWKVPSHHSSLGQGSLHSDCSCIFWVASSVVRVCSSGAGFFQRRADANRFAPAAALVIAFH